MLSPMPPTFEVRMRQKMALLSESTAPVLNWLIMCWRRATGTVPEMIAWGTDNPAQTPPMRLSEASVWVKMSTFKDQHVNLNELNSH